MFTVEITRQILSFPMNIEPTEQQTPAPMILSALWCRYEKERENNDHVLLRIPSTYDADRDVCPRRSKYVRFRAYRTKL